MFDKSFQGYRAICLTNEKELGKDNFLISCSKIKNIFEQMAKEGDWVGIDGKSDFVKEGLFFSPRGFVNYTFIEFGAEYESHFLNFYNKTENGLIKLMNGFDIGVDSEKIFPHGY